MAYAVALDQTCNDEYCDARATHEVRTRFNEVMFRCCERHAKDWVTFLNAKEGGNRADQRSIRRL